MYGVCVCVRKSRRKFIGATRIGSIFRFEFHFTFVPSDEQETPAFVTLLPIQAFENFLENGIYGRWFEANLINLYAC